MALIKKTIIEKIAEKNGLTDSKAKDTVEILLETIKSTLTSGEDVMISNFGKFEIQEKAPRRGRNPATGEDMMLDGRKVVAYKCSGNLRDRINKN